MITLALIFPLPLRVQMDLFLILVDPWQRTTSSQCRADISQPAIVDMGYLVATSMRLKEVLLGLSLKKRYAPL